MKKIILTAVICLVFLMIPFSVYADADEDPQLIVAGIPVTESGQVTGEGITGSVVWDAETRTLTLDNAEIFYEPEIPEEPYFTYESTYTLFFRTHDTEFAAVYSTHDELTVKGNGTIHGLGSAILTDNCNLIVEGQQEGLTATGRCSYGIASDGTESSLTLKGKIYPSVKGGFRGRRGRDDSASLLSGGNLMVSREADIDSNDSVSEYGIYSKGTLTVYGALQLHAREEMLTSDGNIVIDGGSVKLTAGPYSNRAALHCRNLRVKDSKVTINTEQIRKYLNDNSMPGWYSGLYAYSLEVEGKSKISVTTKGAPAVLLYRSKLTLRDGIIVTTPFLGKVKGKYICSSGTDRFASKVVIKKPKSKYTNKLLVEGLTVKIKHKKLKKKTQTSKKGYYFIEQGAGNVTFKKYKGHNKIKVNKKTGNIIVKKGLRKGKYPVKVKIKAAGDNLYKAKTVKVKVTIIVR